MALLGKQIQLKAISQRGKNQIRDHGDRWTVLAETDVIARITVHPDISKEPGPWLFVAPFGHNQNDKASKWIHLNNDKDFVVIAKDDLTSTKD